MNRCVLFLALFLVSVSVALSQGIYGDTTVYGTMTAGVLPGPVLTVTNCVYEGGTYSNRTHYYRLCATNRVGRSLWSPVVSASNHASSNAFVLTWTPIGGATGWLMQSWTNNAVVTSSVHLVLSTNSFVDRATSQWQSQADIPGVVTGRLVVSLSKQQIADAGGLTDATAFDPYGTAETVLSRITTNNLTVGGWQVWVAPSNRFFRIVVGENFSTWVEANP